jgi:hypothetical protein
MYSIERFCEYNYLCKLSLLYQNDPKEAEKLFKN